MISMAIFTRMASFMVIRRKNILAISPVQPLLQGMYGLPHGGLIANVLLEKCLNKAGYFQPKYVPGL
jgi:hypothetical protein